LPGPSAAWTSLLAASRETLQPKKPELLLTAIMPSSKCSGSTYKHQHVSSAGFFQQDRLTCQTRFLTSVAPRLFASLWELTTPLIACSVNFSNSAATRKVDMGRRLEFDLHTKAVTSAPNLDEEVPVRRLGRLSIVL